MATVHTTVSDPVWDVVVIGCGAAGLMTCLELPSDLQVLLLSKDNSPRSASRWAQGGIAAVTRPEDSLASHRQDTLDAGAGLCEPEAVAVLVQEAPACVERLLQLGMAFDRHDGALSTTLEAAHSHRRVLHAQDRTGGALVDVLERHVLQRSNVTQRMGVMALQLWLEGGRCCGVQALEPEGVRWIRSRSVVLASGGGGHLFAHTTNPAQASGDGLAMAYLAGAQLRDLEFVQFHPTALMLPGAPHFLISEAVRGEGAHLHDSDGHSPVNQLAGGDLAPRDQVSRALARTMTSQGVDHLWLDLRPVGERRLQEQFPTIVRRCLELGLNPLNASIPVAPAAHYWMGGIRTDLNAATTVPGLYAVGEVASTGVHGANRLASNSLMECLVFARRLARALPDQLNAEAVVAGGGTLREQATHASEAPCGLEDMRNLVRQICWQVAGVERQGPLLREGLVEIQRLERTLRHWPLLVQLQQLGPDARLHCQGTNQAQMRVQVDLRHRLTLAELLIGACLFRRESRGGHYRTDAPASQPFWQRHTLQQRGCTVRTEPIG